MAAVSQEVIHIPVINDNNNNEKDITSPTQHFTSPKFNIRDNTVFRGAPVSTFVYDTSYKPTTNGSYLLPNETQYRRSVSPRRIM